jgi:predicted nucleotidyltransferase
MNLNELKISQDELNNICKKYLIKELLLFGSVNTDKFNDESDIDLLVTFEDNTNYSLFDVVRIQESFEKFFNRSVDLISKKAIQQSRNTFRRESILNNAKVIYVS